VAHAIILAASGGRDQENCNSKPTHANSSRDHISKISNTKGAGGVAQGISPAFKPQYHKKKKKKKSNAGGITITDLELYRVIVTKSVWYHHKKRRVDQWNRIEDPEVNQPSDFRQRCQKPMLIVTKGNILYDSMYITIFT
jgi:hypothetical protein